MTNSRSDRGRIPALRVLRYVWLVAEAVALVLILVPIVQHPSGPFAPGQVALIVFGVIVVLLSIGLGVYRIRFNRRNAARRDET